VLSIITTDGWQGIVVGAPGFPIGLLCGAADPSFSPFVGPVESELELSSDALRMATAVRSGRQSLHR
jgi:hypothetical protein